MTKRILIPDGFVEINVIQHECTDGWYIRLEHTGVNIIPNEPRPAEVAIEGSREYETPIEAIHEAWHACEALGLTVGSKFYITNFESKTTSILTVTEFFDILNNHVNEADIEFEEDKIIVH